MAERVLTELLARRDTDVDSVAPELYQERLEQLSASSLPTLTRIDAARHVDPRKADDMAGHVARLRCGSSGRAARLTSGARAWRGWKRSSRRCSPPGSSTCWPRRPARSPSASRPDGAQAFFAQPGTIRTVLGAVHDAGTERPAALVTLARAGGGALAQAVLAAITNLIDPRTRGPFHALLEVLDPETVRDALTSLYRKEPAVGRELLGAFAALGDVAGVAESARAFLGDSEANVRLDAYQLLFRSELSPSRFESLLQRALADKDARVDRPGARPGHALDACRGGQGARRLHRRGAHIHHRTQAVPAARLLAHAGGAEGTAVLTRLLAARHTTFQAPMRRVSRVIADALAGTSDAEAVAAARAWHRSAAGLLSRMRGDAGGGA